MAKCSRAPAYWTRPWASQVFDSNISGRMRYTYNQPYNIPFSARVHVSAILPLSMTVETIVDLCH